MTLDDGLYQVSTNSFTAGFVIENGALTMCAPILRKRFNYWVTQATKIGRNRMSSNSAKIQANFKTGSGHNASLINVYADNPDELTYLLEELGNAIPTLIALEQQLQAGGAVAASIPVAPVQDAPQSYAPPAVVDYGQPQAAMANPYAGPPTGGPQVETDRYGNRYTYGLADAPLLPDGRGNYIRKDWTSQQGKQLKAWVDPSKGPRPFAKGAAESEIIWIR